MLLKNNYITSFTNWLELTMCAPPEKTKLSKCVQKSVLNNAILDTIFSCIDRNATESNLM